MKSRMVECLMADVYWREQSMFNELEDIDGVEVRTLDTVFAL